jgi:hypothetical protein
MTGCCRSLAASISALDANAGLAAAFAGRSVVANPSGAELFQLSRALEVTVDTS